MWNSAPAPALEHSATRAPGTWLLTHSPRTCCTPRITRCSICTFAPAWLKDIVPPSVVTGWLPVMSMWPSSTKPPPSPGPQKPSASSWRMISNENGS